MIIAPFDLIRLPISPDKANAPLIVDADRMLPLPVPLKLFQTITRKNSQIVQPRRRNQKNDFFLGLFCEFKADTFESRALKDRRRHLVCEPLPHFGKRTKKYNACQ